MSRTASIRLRLTLLYSGVLFTLAAVLVTSLYIGVKLSLDSTPDLYGDGRATFARQVNEHALAILQTYSFGALAALFVASLVVGWIVAGHVLRPIDRITSVMREIQVTDLSRRIALPGPDDELARLADTFDGMLDRLEAAFVAQRRFIADASHELRNPVGTIRANAALILEGRGDAATQARRIDRAGARMATLVDDLLALARLEAGTSHREQVAVTPLVAELADEFAGTAERHGVRLRLAGTESGSVPGDAGALRRAIANVLDNALRHSPSGAAVHLGAGRVRDWIWIGVRDEGRGIAPADRPHLFERFWRADAARTRDRGGTGLGLAITREIVRSHGGDVAVDSALGGGATFVLWLPVVGGSPHPPPTRLPAFYRLPAPLRQTTN